MARLGKMDALKIRLNETFRARTDTAFEQVFGVRVLTDWDWGIGGLKTVRLDGQTLTPEQLLWLAGWSDGYADALGQVKAAVADVEPPEPNVTATLMARGRMLA